MNKIGIFYGSTFGHTRRVAEQIQQAFGSENADLFSIEKATVEAISKYDNLIVGTSTRSVGERVRDEIRETSEKFFKEEILNQL